MIPNTDSKILVSEDWKKIYQSYKNADFKSYDFETLKRTMISYLQEKYPEDFNDFIDSSEYIALIDLMAFLGQNLSFRIDLNARENFLETAERRDSVLRLAQLISYTPTRNIPASGLMKITSISTTDSVIDSNGTNLANTVINWNDFTNNDWYQQFINIINSALLSNFGNPYVRKTLEGVRTEIYQLNSVNDDVSIFRFTKNINGISMPFEIVPSTIKENDVIEELPPKPSQSFSIVYKDDNQGSSSSNSGFFVKFIQGILETSEFSLDTPVPNEIIGINSPGINDTDYWLWQINTNGEYEILWTPVKSTSNNSANIIYNSINKNIRTIYSVTSRENDEVDLNFADGVFGDLPKGNFIFFYRKSNGLSYVIKPDDLAGVVISIPYVNKSNQLHTLQLNLSLQYTVSNSAGSETNENIKLKAPQSYYLQNRMITGEDYNIAPLLSGTDVIKVKSINRLSSGLSKYYDITDVTGKYSSTNIFADDGMIYQDVVDNYFEFEFSNRNQIISVVKNNIANIINSNELKNFYFFNYSRIDVSNLNILWYETNRTPDQSRGYLYDILENIYAVGNFTANNLVYFKQGANVKFVAPSGKYFDTKHNIKPIPTTGIPTDGKTYIWAYVFQVVNDGANSGLGNLSDGTGPIILSTRVPRSAILAEIIPKYIKILPFSVENEITNICSLRKNFGLTINNVTREWDIIINSNLKSNAAFSLSDQTNNENENLDASWLIQFIWDGNKYKVKSRSVNFIFESEKQTAFYFDKNLINYDYLTNSIIKDKIEILSINSKPTDISSLGINYAWEIIDSITEIDGYVQPNKVKITFYDYNGAGQILNPDAFNDIVDPFSVDSELNFRNKFLFFKKNVNDTTYKLTDDDIISYPNENAFFINNPETALILNGSLYHFYENQNVIKYWSSALNSLIYTDEYFAKIGRSGLKFQYVHNVNAQRRIDPGKTNIIDIYLLTLSYDNEYRSWLLGSSDVEPLPLTNQSLNNLYGKKLNDIKAISDEIIFHSAKYKVLFGETADINLQATFKVVKSNNADISDTEIKTKIFNAVNSFFSLEYWDFGQTFYFSELSAFVMNKLTPYVSTFIIVPKGNNNFGSLYEIKCKSDEIFINGTKISDIEIIDAVTAAQIKSSTDIITSTGQ